MSRILRGGLLRVFMWLALCGAPACPAAGHQPDLDPDVDGPAPSRRSDPDTRAKAIALENKAIAAFSKGRFAEAETLLREQLELQPGNYVVYYNLACARTAQGDHDDGMKLLVAAIEHGFDDIREMERDSSLRALHQRPEYREIVDRWPDLLAARRDANVQSVLEFFDRSYRVERDDRLRLVYVSAVSESSAAVARREITRLGDWASKEVFAGLLDKPESDRDPWVVVVLPTREDFRKWVISRHGQGAVTGMSSIGGEYDHDAKILVAQDLGSSLRHEFFHVLHWRSCMRLGQRHAMWVQEGICSLVEDYTAAGDSITIDPSWRTNIVKRLERVGQLTSIADLCRMQPSRFMGTRVLASYARARASFLFLWQRGLLRQWYENYTTGFEQDPTGLAAWEKTLGMPVKQIDLSFRGWVRSLDMVPEQIVSGMASLGVEVESGEADGLIVSAVLNLKPGSLGGPLRVGDVITDIDGKSTRDIAELVRVLGSYSPGDSVEVGVRRGRLTRTEKVVLTAKK